MRLIGTRSILLSLALVILCVIFLSPITPQETRQKVYGVVGTVKGSGAQGETSSEQEVEATREWEYRRALQYEGTGARVQAFLEKARSGQPFTVSAIGGSVSKGRGLTPPERKMAYNPRSVTAFYPELRRQQADHGLEEDASELLPLLGATTLYSVENLHMLIFQFLNETFPHPENRFVNGAQGGVGAGYFGWCFKEHIPEDSDLVLVELGINDLTEMEVVGAYENVIRGILELDSRPAVINIETFSTLFHTLLSSSSLHQDVAAFYDVPSLSVRDVILPRILADPHDQLPIWFRTGDTVVMGDDKVREWGGVPVDLMHISVSGHALAASLVIRYLNEQMDLSKPSSRTFAVLGRFAPSSIRKPTLRILDVPDAALTMPFDPLGSVVRHNPTCRSMNSGVLHSPPPTMPPDHHSDGDVAGLILAPGSHGWEPWHWKEKSYIVASDPGALASFHIDVLRPVLAPETPPVPEVALEEVMPISVANPHPNRFKPLPLGMRVGGPYNIQPIGVNKRIPSLKRQAEMLDEEVREGEETAEEQAQEVEAEEKGDTGRVMIGYQRSAVLGLGSVWCWVDEDRDGGKMIDGYWEIQRRNMGMVTEVISGLSPGPHMLHCELLNETSDPDGGTEFRIFALMHD